MKGLVKDSLRQKINKIQCALYIHRNADKSLQKKPGPLFQTIFNHLCRHMQFAPQKQR
jgi:hypothetical protein